MVSCLRCPVATVFLLYVVRHQHVRHVTEEYGCARPVKTLYYDVQSSKVTGAHAMQGIPPSPTPECNPHDAVSQAV